MFKLKDVPLHKFERYEIKYIQYVWIILIIALPVKIALSDYKGVLQHDYSSLIRDLLFFLLLNLWLFVKCVMIKKRFLEKLNFYMLYKVPGLIFLSVLIVLFDAGYWIYSILVYSILLTSLLRGFRPAIILAGISFITHVPMLIYKAKVASPLNITTGFQESTLAERMAAVVLLYAMMLLFSFLCGRVYKDDQEHELDNKRLLAELEEKYDQLAVAQNEIKYHFEQVKETNIKLEETNKKLTESIAEFYTLQQISQAISSILDIRELLKYVNDIILGVMGVNYSTIILRDDLKDRLKVERTNIKNQEELTILRENIDCKTLKHVLNSGKPVLENFVDPEVFVFTKDRNVNSLICVPLSSKSKKFGLVLVEHKFFNAFDEENVRLLDIIGQQVGIAMENAELYQKMQELATIDGLTGVYNRLYFQQRLQTEFTSAKEGNYELSVAIFDVDLFKDFNDTYGHLFGDKVIKEIAALVKGALRKSDVIARYGGEEFVILFPRTGIQEAFEKAEALREKIAVTIIKDNLVESSVTASFGVSSFPQFSTTESELLRSADNALYEAKASGRNCVKIVKRA